jgi:futalosine hydrolase
VTRLLAVCAVEAEAQALAAGLPGAAVGSVGPLPAWTGMANGLSVDIVVAGVGPAAAAAAAGIALALADGTAGGGYDAILSAGIAGAFKGGPSQVGGVVIADDLIAADLGVLAPEGFLDVESLGFGTALGRATTPQPLIAMLAKRCAEAGLATSVGPILTLSSFTGTDERALLLAQRYSPAAEAMEGTGMATAAAHYGIPVVEIRTISNWVGNRDREAWDLAGALDALRRASTAVLSAGWEW